MQVNPEGGLVTQVNLAAVACVFSHAQTRTAKQHGHFDATSARRLFFFSLQAQLLRWAWDSVPCVALLTLFRSRGHEWSHVACKLFTTHCFTSCAKNMTGKEECLTNRSYPHRGILLIGRTCNTGLVVRLASPLNGPIVLVNWTLTHYEVLLLKQNICQIVMFFFQPIFYLRQRYVDE